MQKSAYHHGNLQEALLEAARGILIEQGVEAVTLRAVARRAGVSVGAPYHHYVDKAALVGALVQRCFSDMDQAARQSLTGKQTATEKLKAIGVAYIMYAVAHPAEFRLMFRPEKGSLPQTNKTVQEPVYGLLMEVIQELHAQGRGTTLQNDVITAWSLAHGFASLLIDGPLHELCADRGHVRLLAEGITEGLAITN